MNENLNERIMSLRDEALQRIDPKQEQWKQRYLINEQGHITQVPEIVWCSQCIHAEEDCEIAFCFGRRDDWCCADGEQRGMYPSV